MTTPTEGAANALGGLFLRLFDDAATFPPGNAPMPDAVKAHLRWRTGPDSAFVGPFVCPVSRLDELAAALGGTDARLQLSLIFPGGAAATTVEAALAAVHDGVDIVAVEVPVRPDQDVQQRCVELSPLRDAAADVYVELPWPLVGNEGVSTLAASGFRLKLRTGGVTASGFPTEAELAHGIRAAVDAKVPFKLTAGLHHAVRHRDRATGFEHHGFLNVMVATSEALLGRDLSDVLAALQERDADQLGAHLKRLSASVVSSARSSFTSFGTCSIDEPLADLRALHLLEGSAA